MTITNSSSPTQSHLESLLANATAKLRFMATMNKSVKPKQSNILISKPKKSSTPTHVGQQAALITAHNVEIALSERPNLTSKAQTILEARKETMGDKWYNLPATELTPELKNDIFLIQHRHVLDPKRHYKKVGQSSKLIPKYFHVGRIIEPKHEFYSSRLTNKQRKSTMVDELLGDRDKKQYFKTRAQAISIFKAKSSKKWFAIKSARRAHLRKKW